MKKILLSLIAISIFCLSKTYVYADENFDKYLQNNWNKVELATKVKNKLFDYYNIRDEFKDEYPLYYGGMYINEDASKLVIQIVKNKIPVENSEEYKFYNELITLDENIKIEYVENSFNELNYYNNTLSDFMDSHNNIVSSYISQENNKTVVEVTNTNESVLNNYLKELNNQQKISIKNISNDLSKIILFKKGENSNAHINAGGKIIINLLLDSYCSMGFRTMYNGEKGYLTAGHCVINKDSILSGKVITKQFANNQKYDYAFIETGLLYSPSNSLEYPQDGVNTLAVVASSPATPEGAYVAKNGTATGYTDGKITGLNVTDHYDNFNVTIQGLVRTSVVSDYGDSGGPFFIPRTDAQGGAIPIGILSGGSSVYTNFTSINSLPFAYMQGRY